MPRAGTTATSSRAFVVGYEAWSCRASRLMSACASAIVRPGFNRPSRPTMWQSRSRNTSQYRYPTRNIALGIHTSIAKPPYDTP